MPKHQMRILESDGERMVRFAGPYGSDFKDFTEVMPALADQSTQANFLRKCDRGVEKACGNSACAELVEFDYSERPNRNASALDRVAGVVVGVHVTCYAPSCPLDAEQTIPELPPVASSNPNRLLPAKMR